LEQVPKHSRNLLRELGFSAVLVAQVQRYLEQVPKHSRNLRRELAFDTVLMAQVPG
jgi:chemotaxis regulatin CheY-phosphate phosphatase CheZ